MQRESFFLNYIFIFDKWSKTVQKNINILRRWSTNASKAGDERSSLKSFLVNILYRNSLTLEPDYWYEVTAEAVKRVRKITKVDYICLFVNFVS